MPCFKPLSAYRAKDGGVTFDRRASFLSIPIKLPCGRCSGCLFERSRQWAMRCFHESKMHMFNEYVTLTYDNEHLPSSGSLVRPHTQLFLKRLRKSREPAKVRFFGCGEYGPKNKRPHYHMILFNVRFADRKRYKQNSRGEWLYTSKELDELWGMGECTTGDVTFDSAAYCARYVLKKMGHKDFNPEAYVSRYGEVLEPEFPMMSLKPGIGFTWFEKFGRETYTHDSVIVNRREMRPPRFYDKKMKELDPDRMEVLKKNRRKKMKLFAADTTEDRLRVREVIHLAKMKAKKRTL